MLIAQEEKRSNAALIVFVDLLFLLVAFVVLLLFFLQERHRISEQALEGLEKSLSRITGEEMQIPEALARLETYVEKYVSEQEMAREREKRLAERRKRKAVRTTFRLEYQVIPGGRIAYQEKTYTLAGFRLQVVKPLRKTHWVAFRGFADPQTPFGEVVESRLVLLKNSNEFDTYWDNVTRTPAAPGGAQ